MNASEIKQKLLLGQMSDEEFASLINRSHSKKNDGFLKTLVNGFQKVYAEPRMLNLVLEFSLLLLIVAGIIALTYAGKLDVMITAVLLSLITGYLLGKTR